jgi:hypothetical protein
MLIIGRPSWEMSRWSIPSGCAKSKLHSLSLLVMHTWMAFCTSAMEWTGVLLIEMSHAPRRFVRHRGILLPGVLGDIVASRTRPSFSMKDSPAVLCLLWDQICGGSALR